MCKIILLSLSYILSLGALEEHELIWKEVPPVVEYNRFLQEAIRDQEWWAVVDYAQIISCHFPKSPFAQETSYLIGEAYFKMGQFELANENFSAYMSQSTSPKHFEEAIHYKFQIAEQYRNGARKPLFGSHKLPKIVSGEEDALAIYDDVLSSLPHSEIAASALLGKAKLQVKSGDYKLSLETLDLLIRRFPKHDLAVQAFLEKSQVYLLQCGKRSFDPALLDLADLNLRKFRLAFPREERLVEVEKNCAKMQELRAEQLMETGRFFEKTKKIPAAILYYSKVISEYSQTQAAQTAKEQLDRFEMVKSP